jgi:hypothetical protein
MSRANCENPFSMVVPPRCETTGEGAPRPELTEPESDGGKGYRLR